MVSGFSPSFDKSLDTSLTWLPFVLPDELLLAGVLARLGGRCWRGKIPGSGGLCMWGGGVASLLIAPWIPREQWSAVENKAWCKEGEEVIMGSIWQHFIWAVGVSTLFEVLC